MTAAHRGRSNAGSGGSAWSVSSLALWTWAALLLVIVGAVLALQKPALKVQVKTAARSMEIPPPPIPENTPLPDTRIVADSAEIKAASTPAEERIILMEEQVRRLKEYAQQRGPDDPFALTDEQIREFRRRGDPIIW